ncbi:unnamed protein product [Cylicocyclus nassatus]|uniref:GYF domain-containing protein n=1 Tax=Cylicocyclus nassatus TaxID=53992 RepID=A0AA36GU76_CYLNA|nr:unnamed protein product [Cylicocyclus nassatus]
MSKRAAVSFADDIASGSGSNKRIALSNDDGDEFDLPESDEPQKEREEDEEEVKKRHTLDSDEEEEDDHKKLDMRKVEGQEDSTLDFDGSMKITAFNMKEDMEDGHFDDAGNFIFDKKEKEIKDAWLDDIDWTTIKEKAGDQWEQSNDRDDDDVAPPTLNDIRRKEIFVSLISRMKPNQTVAKALSDLKKAKGLSAAEERKLRWKAKKEGKTLSESDSQKETQLISGLADELISAGHMDVYDWTREKLEFLVKKLDSSAVDSVDMFSDEPATASSAPNTGASIMDDEEQKWEYKESESSEIQGPFSSSEMARRQQNGKLSSSGLARKCGTASFNPVARIDFDLYC